MAVTLSFVCVVDGGWSAWSEWTPCPVTCGGGTQDRSKTCNNPAPQFGGNVCSGVSAASRDCGTDACPSIGLLFIDLFSHINKHNYIDFSDGS